ncbi:F-box domain containing protein [Tanacetum coccineum]
MKKINKSTFDDLPDEIVLQILSKLSDLKTLCICELVSKRVYRSVLQVEAISFMSVTYPLVHPLDMSLIISFAFTLTESFKSVMLSLKKFTRVKSVRIQLASSYNNPLLFKWTIKFGNNLDSLLFLSPNSIYHNHVLYDKQNSHEEEDVDMKVKTMFLLLMDANISHGMLLCCIEHIPLLENISITDSSKRRMISYSGKKITEIRNSLNPPYETIEHMLLTHKHVLRNVGHCYVPLLKLPFSGFIMKEVTLSLWEREDLPDLNSLLKTGVLDDDFEDEEDGAYNEAMKEMLKELRRQMEMHMHVA